jgi:hypothetical protein
VATAVSRECCLGNVRGNSRDSIRACYELRRRRASEEGEEREEGRRFEKNSVRHVTCPIVVVTMLV